MRLPQSNLKKYQANLEENQGGLEAARPASCNPSLYVRLRTIRPTFARGHMRKTALVAVTGGMKIRYMLARAATSVVVLALIALSAAAQNYPAPKEGTWIARDFRFHTGEVMPELRLHYRTIGEPSGEPVLILHGTTQSSASLLSPTFAGELFGPGQPLDASKYFIILPDAIGHGKSAKPSDGLRTKFPVYNYDDMVAAQYKLVTEGLGIRHVRLILGYSMGGMQSWIWGVNHPDFMDALVPMASQPTEMSSRNWMMRRLITDTIRNDPEWKDGNYTTQPRRLQGGQRVLWHRHQRRHPGVPEDGAHT